MPPLEAPALQVIPTYVLPVLTESLAKFVGASGTVAALGNTPPLPEAELLESPIALIATILAWIEVPVVRLNGDALSVSVGIVQLVDEIMVESVAASQCTRS